MERADEEISQLDVQLTRASVGINDIPARPKTAPPSFDYGYSRALPYTPSPTKWADYHHSFRRDNHFSEGPRTRYGLTRGHSHSEVMAHRSVGHGGWYRTEHHPTWHAGVDLSAQRQIPTTRSPRPVSPIYNEASEECLASISRRLASMEYAMHDLAISPKPEREPVYDYKERSGDYSYGDWDGQYNDNASVSDAWNSDYDDNVEVDHEARAQSGWSSSYSIRQPFALYGRSAPANSEDGYNKRTYNVRASRDVDRNALRYGVRKGLIDSRRLPDQPERHSRSGDFVKEEGSRSPSTHRFVKTHDESHSSERREYRKDKTRSKSSEKLTLIADMVYDRLLYNEMHTRT